MFGKYLGKSLLDKQRPKKRRSKFSKTKRLCIIFLISITSIIISYVIFLRYEPYILKKIQTNNKTPIDWKVSIRPQNYILLKDKHKRIIDGQVKNHLLNGSRDELQVLTDNILLHTEFDKVLIRRNKMNHINIHINIPEPIALIEADKLRFVSKNGTIFGNEENSNNSGFIKLKGIFSDFNGAFNFTKTNKLIVSEKILNRINNCIDLINLSSQQNLNINIIDYDPYRGVSIKINDNVHVSIGHKPYRKNYPD